MGMNVTYKPNKNLERELARVVADRINDVTAELKTWLGRAVQSHQGQPLTTIQPLLDRELARLGLKMDRAEQNCYAQLIRDGVQITA